MKDKSEYICPKCGKNDWTRIPQSLAEFCSCGEVRVLEDDGTYSRGASMQEWMNDLIKAKRARSVISNATS